MKVRISPEWRPGMELECDDRRGQQVFCATHDPGLQWIDAYDDLPPPVRSRLAHSRYNLCPTCIEMEAKGATKRRPPPVSVYLAVISAVEAAIAAELVR
jgi:hypothetical protein